jgi:hypothetical protein
MAMKKTTKAAAKRAQAPKQTKTRSAKTSPKQTKADAGAKKMSALDAAAKVLNETRQPMTCRDLVDQMAAKGYWTSPGGATPWSTLNAAIAREIKVKGADSRFVKAERGKFARA